MSKKFNRLVFQINRLVKNERLGSENEEKLTKLLKKLYHALDVKNIKEARKAIDELSKEIISFRP